MNCLIENEYIKVKKREKKRKKQRKKKTEKKTNGKTRYGKKKREKISWRTLLRGGVIIFSRELAYFIAGGLLTPCEH